MGISIPQLLIILLIVALLFGTKKLRSIGSDLGSALKGFRNAMKDDESSSPQNRDNPDNNVLENPSETADGDTPVQKKEEHV